jgi:CBS domain-containing protein
MLRLREIMTTDVVTVAADASIREAMEILSRHHVSGAPVVSGSSVVGLVTANDLMTFVAALSGVSTEQGAGDSWSEWAEPVLGDEVEQGDDPTSTFFSGMWNDAGADVVERMATPSTPEWNNLEEHDVSEVMTRAPLVTLAPDASAETAADVMREKRIHRVLVTEDERLVGIVSSLDIVRAAADHRFTTRTFVFGREEPRDMRR